MELRGVGKRFGSFRALRGLDLAVRPGAVVGLLGPNGSGKSTTLRLLLDILLPDEGTVRVLGHERLGETRGRVGYVPEERGLYPAMAVGAFLAYLGRLRGVPARGLEARIAAWLERVGLGDKVRAPCGSLSRGQQQRVQAVGALLHGPDLLVLDEPFSGIDPVNRRVLSEVFAAERARGCTTIFSTHQLHHAEEICDHVVLLEGGEKVLDAPLASLLGRSGALVAELADPGADPAPLAAVPGVARVRVEGPRLRIELQPGADGPEVLRRVASTVRLTHVGLERETLEDVFVRAVRARRGTS